MAAAGLNVNLSSSRAQRHDRGSVAQRRTKTNGRARKGIRRALGGDDARVGLKEAVNLVADAPARPTLANFGSVELLERDAGGAHRVNVLRHSDGTLARADIETAGFEDQPFARIALQRRPRTIGLLGQLYVRRREIR